MASSSDETESSLPALPGLQGGIEGWVRRALDQHAIMAVTDAAGEIIFANDRFCEISGYVREELLGKTHRVLKSGRHPDAFYDEMWATIAAGRVWSGTICNRAKGGGYYWVESTLMPVPGPEGVPVGYVALRTDVTRLVEAEQQLVVRTQELRLLFDHSPIGLSWREFDQADQPGVNHVNKRFCEIIGLGREEARNIQNIKRVTNPEDWALQEQLTAELYEGSRNSFTMEKRYQHQDGRLVWAALTVVVLRDGEGHVTHHFAMLEDNTARHIAEEELRRSESRWRTYLETASEILYALTPGGTYKFVSQAWTSKLGHEVAEVIGQPYRDFIHPDDLERYAVFFEATLKVGVGQGNIEYRMRHRDGHWVWHASTGSVYSDRDGRRAYFGVGRDITVRRNAQEELKAAVARLEELARIINRSPSVVVLWRAEGDRWPVEFVSASIRQFGYEPEQFTGGGMTFADITHVEDRERVLAEVMAHAENGHREYNQEYRVQGADGAVRWVDDHTIVRTNEAGQVTHHEGVITDITERREVEDQERVRQEREFNLAREVQQHLLPTVFPALGDFEVEVLSQPSLHLGGDYYDVVEVDERRRGFVIADVSGKGAPAALMMAACRASVRLCAQGERSPAEVLRKVNRAIQPDMPPRMFITLFYGILDLDTHELRYSRAGHEAGVLLRGGGGVMETLEAGGMALGLVTGAIFDQIEEGAVMLRAGDVLALHTDGVNEACNVAGEEFGRDRMVGVLRRHAGEPLGDILRRLDRYLRQYCTLATRGDDRALLLVRTKRD